MRTSLKSALLWYITQPSVVITYRRFGQPICPVFKGQEFRTDKLLRDVGEELPLYAV